MHSAAAHSLRAHLDVEEDVSAVVMVRHRAGVVT